MEMCVLNFRVACGGEKYAEVWVFFTLSVLSDDTFFESEKQLNMMFLSDAKAINMYEFSNFALNAQTYCVRAYVSGNWYYNSLSFSLSLNLIRDTNINTQKSNAWGGSGKPTVDRICWKNVSVFISTSLKLTSCLCCRYWCCLPSTRCSD